MHTPPQPLIHLAALDRDILDILCNGDGRSTTNPTTSYLHLLDQLRSQIIIPTPKDT